MNITLKNMLVGAAAVGILLVGVSGWRYASFYGSSIEPSSFRSFSVTAEGKTAVVPDVAEVALSVVTEGGIDIAALQKKNTEKMNSAIAFLKEKKISEKDIKTQSYSINPRYQNTRCPIVLSYPETDSKPCPPPEIVGYSIRQNVTVKIRDFSVIGDVLSETVLRGVNSVSGPSFTIDDRFAIEQEAREEAIEMAKEKAKQIARVGGFTIGRLLSIEEGGYTPLYAQYERAMGGASFDSAQPPTIEAGSEEVRITVTLRYEIR